MGGFAVCPQLVDLPRRLARLSNVFSLPLLLWRRDFPVL